MRLISTDIGILDLDNPQNVETLKRFPDIYYPLEPQIKAAEKERAAAAPAPAPAPVAAPAPLPIAKPSAPAVYSILGSQGSSMSLPPPTNGGPQINTQAVGVQLDRAHAMRNETPLGRGFGAPQPGAGGGNALGNGGLGGAPAETANPYAMVPMRQPVMSAIARRNAGLQNTTPGWGTTATQAGTQAATPYNVFSNPARTTPIRAGGVGSMGSAQYTMPSQWQGLNGGNSFQIGGGGGFGGW